MGNWSIRGSVIYLMHLQEEEEEQQPPPTMPLPGDCEL